MAPALAGAILFSAILSRGLTSHMPEIVSWRSLVSTGDVPPLRSMRFNRGCTHRIRFIGSPVKFYKYYLNGRSAICGDPATCPVAKKYDIVPATRFAMNVLDRDEPDPRQRLKILEKGTDFVTAVAAWSQQKKHDFAGERGNDFEVRVAETKAFKFSLRLCEETAFTGEEKIYLAREVVDLLRVYRPVPSDLIERKLFPVS